MPAAPDLVTLFDFETAYESALANYFTNANASWQVLTPNTIANAPAKTDFLRTPRLMVTFSVTGTEDQRETSNGVEYYAVRTGQVLIQAITSRNNTQQSYPLMRGTARKAMLEREAVFNANSVPYYQTADVWETGSAQTSFGDNYEVITQLTFGVKFFIPPSSFP